MTKAKKAELSIEEKLQAAFVPENEQPYPVPENWCWTRLGEITSIIGGGTPSSSIAEYYDGGKIPWISPADLSGYNEKYISEGAKNITTLGLEKSSARLMPEGTVCLSSRAPIGYVVIARNSLCTNQGFKSFLPSKVYIPEYLYWYLKGNKELLESYASGTTFLELSGSKASKVEIPIAPFKEQQRIIDRIESLFAKLDEAKEKAQAALDSFEMRKAAILHQAFTGELTAQWRKEHGVGMESWEETNIGKICKEVKVGIVIKPSQYYVDKNFGTPAFRSANVREFHIDNFDWVYLNQEGQENNQRSIVHTGDVLVVRSGNPGISCVVTKEFDGYNAIDILIAVPNQEVICSDYLCAFTNSPIGRHLVFANKRGMALAHFNVSGYSRLPIKLPSLQEQRVIMDRVGSILSKEMQAQATTKSLLNRIDLLKKSILARAFRGELGTNDSTEENARELLKKVL